MNRLDLPAAATDDASTLNQRWLAAWIAHWRGRLAQPDAATDAEPPALNDAAAARPLATLFALSPFERDLLLLAAGVEIDPALRDAVAQAQGRGNSMPAGQPLRLQFGLALSLLPQPHWDALSPQAPLRHWRLIDIDTTHGFAQASLRIDERVLHQLTGVAAIDPRLAGIARFDDDAAADEATAAAALPLARALGAAPLAPLLMLADASLDAAHRRAAHTLATAVFAQVGLRTLWVDAEALPRQPAELADVARLIDREAALSGAGIALLPDADAVGGTGRSSAQRLIAQTRSPVLLLGALAPLQAAELNARSVLRFNLPAAALPRHTALQAWPPALQQAAGRAAQQFRVEPALVEQVLAAVAAGSDAADAEAQVWNGLREAARGGLDALAQRVNDGASRTRFADLVLPPAVLAALREMAAQLRHRQQVHDDWGFADQQPRGLGIAALFAGDSGTGKTLAAEAVANEAGLDLYRIDLASVVDKYIGETEKNLARLFDAAERSGAVLLFDEADALFGKRSEVKDSHDRHANIEVAYLLQRIESYRGLAILTSNLKSTLDTAFLRRLRFVVQFPFPDAAAREQIWRRQFPPRAPLGSIDFAALARLQLAGGNIRSVALNAAFAAAAQGEAIGDAVLLASARAEFAKLERHFGGTR